MTFIFPLLYSTVLFISLSLITYFIGRQIQNTQRLEARLSFIQKKIQANPTSSEEYYKLGQLYLTKKLYSKGILAFRQSLKYWNYNDKIGLGSLYNTLGYVYFKLAKYEYAIYYYKLAINFLPDYTLALCNLGFAYEKLRLYKHANLIYLLIFCFEPENKIAKIRLERIKKKFIFTEKSSKINTLN